MTALHDMHCHLDFMENGEEVAAQAAQAGTLLFANTVTPEGYRRALERFGACANVAVGFGMHPWWVVGNLPPEQPSGDEPRNASQRELDRQRAEAARCEGDGPGAKAQRERVLAELDEASPLIIGEVGLDFGWKHVGSRIAQTLMLQTVLAWASVQGGKTISIHSVKAAAETLDAIDRSGAAKSCACIFHWFTGPSNLLKRAIEAGCYFSCGPRMLATGKGREYVKAIPASRLLLETDEPAVQGDQFSYADLHSRLTHVAEDIAAIKGEAALQTIADTSVRLLALRA